MVYTKDDRLLPWTCPDDKFRIRTPPDHSRDFFRCTNTSASSNVINTIDPWSWNVMKPDQSPLLGTSTLSSASSTSDDVDSPDRHQDSHNHVTCHSISAGKAVGTLEEWDTVHDSLPLICNLGADS